MQTGYNTKQLLKEAYKPLDKPVDKPVDKNNMPKGHA